jgi:class 3 adenylate cyclase
MESMSQVLGDALQAGREAIARHAWREAYDLLVEADRERELGPDDLDGLAQAAWWIGRMRDCIAARERAHARYAADGNMRRAAMVSLDLAEHHVDVGETPLAMAWMQRATKELEGQPDCVEQGYLLRNQAMLAFFGGDFAGTEAIAQQAIDAGSHYQDRDLIAYGLGLKGGALIGQGRVDDGMALYDEATIAAVSGDLGPMATGVVYCMMISACANLGDWSRAGQWTEAAKRWCDRQAISGFPGVCRVHRAEVLRLRGSFSDAMEEATMAAAELRNFSVGFAAAAFYELGEVRLHTGDLAGAEEAFQQAHEMGHTPQPGLAYLRLRQGRVDAATTSIKRALAEETMGPLGRVKLLPAQVEVALAAGDLDTARAASEELRELVKTYASPARQASAEAAAALVAFSERDLAAALQSAQRAIRLWNQADLPYEAAHSRIVLATVYLAEDDRESATMELQSARSAFERLGAIPDANDASDRLASLVAPAAEPARRVAKTFVFTDIVRSTNLVEAIGDAAWGDLIHWHDATLRGLFAEHGGTEIDHTGDGFFVAFEDADAALRAAVAIQRRLVDHRRQHGFAPQVRIGVHATEASEAEGSYRGRGVHEAARIGAIAEGGEILVSEESLSGMRLPCAASDPREVTLKGISKPVRVLTLHWQDF